MNRRFTSGVASLVMVALITLSLSQMALAEHAWGNYHWARTANPFTVKVVDSNTSDWNSFLGAAVSDWDSSRVMNVVTEAGDDAQRIRKRCPMVAGKIRSCNATYGYNGWLGLASINISGGVHITQATSKMNDSYLASGYSATNKQHVMCQEIGHGFGLGHQDESGADLGTCMDYSNDLGNPDPNAHDFAQLETIYTHLDSTTTLGFAITGLNPFDDPDAKYKWGALVRQSANGRVSTYVVDHGSGNFTVRHVLWTEEFAERCQGCDHRFDH
ncbi:MAG: hypothetical protein PSX80_16315 [bacterium]|nr:hypothetical protein [bacterium]